MSDQKKQTRTLRRLIERFATSDCSWLSSVRSDGRAHSVPVWHVWNEGRIYVITAPDSVKAANIQANSHVVITHPDPISPVIIEGEARQAPACMEALRPIFRDKYDWDPGESKEYSTVLEITPIKLMAWGEHGEGRWAGVDIGNTVILGEDQ